MKSHSQTTTTSRPQLTGYYELSAVINENSPRHTAVTTVNVRTNNTVSHQHQQQLLTAIIIVLSLIALSSASVGRRSVSYLSDSDISNDL